MKKYILIFILSLLSLLNASDTLLTQEEQAYLDSKKYITVLSLEAFPPFNFTENGVPNGYSIDYMKILGEYLNKEIKFVTVKSWNEGLDKLKSGEIDINPHIAINKNRQEFIEFTNFIHITHLTAFAVNINSNIRSMQDLIGKKIAVPNKTFLHDYLKKTYPNIEIYPAKTVKDSVIALAEGQADAVIGSLPSLTYYINEEWRSNLKVIDIKGIEKIQKTDLPMGVLKGNTLLKSILEKANNSISYKKKLALQNRWMSTNNEEKIDELSEEEKLFLNNHKKIRFRVQSSRPPFETTIDNKAAGIAIDYIDLISKKMGFTPIYVINDMPLNEGLDEVENKREKFDTLIFAVKNEQRSKRFSFGDSYLSYPMMIINNKNSAYVSKLADLNGKLVVLEKGFLTNQWIKRDYPNIKIVNTKNTTEALKFLNDGKADAYVGNIGVANYMIINGGLENIKIAAPTEYGNIEYSFIAPKEWPELTSILSKGFRQITPKEHNLIQQKWFSIQFVEKTNYILFAKILGAIACFVILILIWNIKLNEKVKKGIEKYKQQEDLLIQQSKMAAMGEMINNITHQWKQPLNIISINAEEISDIIQYNGFDKEALLDVEKKIITQVRLMGQTIDDFRNFFKPQKNSDTFKLINIINQTLPLLTARIKKLSLNIKIDEKNAFSLNGNANELKQVLLNILNNTCDAFENCDVINKRVDISFEIKNNIATIIIEDNAGGIPNELLPTKLFDSYITTKGEKGTGIGLYMCKFIINEKFGGDIIASNTDKGAKFILNFPI